MKRNKSCKIFNHLDLTIIFHKKMLEVYARDTESLCLQWKGSSIQRNDSGEFNSQFEFEFNFRTL